MVTPEPKEQLVLLVHKVIKGQTGATGSQGAQGATGPQGVQGSQGAQGATGPTLAVVNNANDRIITATGGSSVNGESNLTFNGTTLSVNGAGITFDGVTMRFTL